MKNVDIGRKVILPSSFTQGPRYIDQNFQDAMALIRKFGKPDLFLTMTCNPNWLEITDNLKHENGTVEKSFLEVKVFKLKALELVKDVVNEFIFGSVICWLYVIEFQKRGLPHMHMLINLSKDDKLKYPNEIDKYISAQIPDSEKDPVLYKSVLKHMVHGPHVLTSLNKPSLPCITESTDKKCLNKWKCKYDYPKKYQTETELQLNGYPKYARPDNGVTAKVGHFEITNVDIVPHNPFLIKKYDSHINVEHVIDIKAIKYLTGYVNKGPDRAEVEIIEDENVLNHDETKKFLDTRYVSSCESIWRLFEYKMKDASHSVYRLPVHLKDKHKFYFNESDSVEDLTEKMKNKKTELMAYFELNKIEPKARELFYQDIPESYTFDSKKCCWYEKKRHCSSIGRLTSVSPSDKDKFYLRLLLLNVKGKTSFEDLCTVDNIEYYPNYGADCLALGLIKNDEEWKFCLREASSYQMPVRLRSLFVRIIVHCNPISPKELWLEFRDEMSEDYQRDFDTETAYKKAYVDIMCKIIDEGSGKSIKDFPDLKDVYTSNDLLNIVSDSDVIDKVKEMELFLLKYNQMNKAQKKVTDCIRNLLTSENTVETGLKYAHFLNGCGGSGKTFVYIAICHLCNALDKSFSTVSHNGIAATHLPKGRTLHNRFDLHLDLSQSRISPRTGSWEELKGMNVLIWDEAPTSNNKVLTVVDEKLREIMKNDLPFGGKIMLLGGDFRQTLPILEHATKIQLIQCLLKYHRLWKFFTIHDLHENMRAKPDEKEFVDYILSVGDGSINDDEEKVLLPDQSIMKSDLVEEVYGDVIRSENLNELANRAILAPLNIEVNDINLQVLSMLPDKEIEYSSIDHAELTTGEIDQSQDIDYLNSLTPSGLPPHKLFLKVGAIVSLKRNLNVKKGLVNGTRMKVEMMSKNIVACTLLSGNRKGEFEFIPRITLIEDKRYPFVLYRHQFPIQLAFAMTIHKAQGCTFEKIGLDLRSECFTHGQLYVALSRVRSFDGLKIRLSDDNIDNRVKNVVYKEIFDD